MGTNTCVVVCPHCNKEFEMTNAAYNDILQQVRNQTFNKEVESRVRDKLTAALHDKVEPLERKLEIEAREHAAEVKALKAKHDADLEHAVEKASLRRGWLLQRRSVRMRFLRSEMSSVPKSSVSKQRFSFIKT